MPARCVFCDIATGAEPATIVFADAETMSFLPLPEGRLAAGHILVISKRHIADVFEARHEDLDATMHTVQRVSEALRASLGATGVNILNASGPNSDQSVFHLHFHVVPRWADDKLSTWPDGRSAHEVRDDYVALLREALT